MNKKIATEIALGIIVLAAIIAADVIWINNRKNPIAEKPIGTERNQVFCTQEAKLCPDGKTYVSRTGPNCEFAACPSMDWHTYTDSQYGFTLTFPDSWKGYVVKHRTLDWGSDGTSDSLDFGFPAQDSLFNVSFHTQKQYDALSSSGAPFGMKLGENNGIVFVWDRAQYAANKDMENRMAEIQDIIKTFKIIK